METGLVQSRQEFILPDDAYPTLENAYVWREKIKRKRAYSLLCRLNRVVGTTDAGTGDFVGVIGVTPIASGQVTFTVGSTSFTDPGGASPVNLLTNGAATAILDRATATLTITGNTENPLTAINYFPGLPVMGLRTKETDATNDEQLVAFDQNYAYRIIGGACTEFIPGTTWSGNDSDFFWTTNYWINSSNLKLFWVTNFSANDPIRYTDGLAWTDFAPVISGAGLGTEQKMYKALCMLPFRGRLVSFNTFEGLTSGGIAGSVQQFQRIRWAAIGNPILTNSWYSDIRGKGGFLDIPTSESIISVGFVRDNLVIYCERSTWQLRYTGRSIAPFQIEKVNSELGAESTFSAVQFDTSLVGIGDKGIVECDSYKSDRIDIKIPDLVYSFNNNNNGTKRVHGIRNFPQRLAFWIYPLGASNGTFPDRRLVYNYENDSWGIYTDSLTCLGNYQPLRSLRWQDFPPPDADNNWEALSFPWVDGNALSPAIVGGNQQGYVEVLDIANTNDFSLFIQNITGNTTTPTVIESKNHNLPNNAIISINGLPATDPFFSLNGNVFQVEVNTINSFQLWVYDALTGEFSTPRLDLPGVYQGFGQIAVRDNFSIVSKKFNFLDDGQNIQMGYLDVLLDDTANGAISLNVYLDYNDDSPVNTFPQNELVDGNQQPDTFFNTVVPTTRTAGLAGSKNWQRVICPVRGAFITLEWTLSNEQMTNQCQESDVQIDSQILWIRRAGKQLPIGV